MVGGARISFCLLMCSLTSCAKSKEPYSPTSSRLFRESELSDTESWAYYYGVESEYANGSFVMLSRSFFNC